MYPLSRQLSRGCHRIAAFPVVFDLSPAWGQEGWHRQCDETEIGRTAEMADGTNIMLAIRVDTARIFTNIVGGG